jgi:hypothetical protein
MSNTNTGGPAFPFPAYTYPNGEINHGEGGMTLRDYFAAKAMLVYFQGPDIKVIAKHPDAIASWCYIMADSMLKAREA